MPFSLKPEYNLGDSVDFNGRTITPITKTWRCQVGNQPVALIWNRPASILVRQQDGSEEVIPVPDITRRVILAILGAGLGAVFLILITNQVISKTTKPKR